MYTSYFGLSERPFSIAPDPQYLYMSTRHKEAMAHLSYGLSQGGCFIVLTGEVGTGKTTLCRNLLSELADNVDVALILNPKINELELLQTVCDELKIDHQADQSQKQLLDLINQDLLSTYADNRQTVLIIDEAQLLSRDVLEQVRLLTNLETTKQKLLQIILIGQPELNDVLSRNDLRQLAQRVTARYHLGALQKSEIEDYVNYRLGVAGCRQPLFSKQALSRLYGLTGGIPRKINVLADHALLSTYSKTENLVNAQTVKVAAREVFIAAQKRKPAAPYWLLALRRWWLPVAALLLLNVGLWWWFADNSLRPATVVEQAGEASRPPAQNESAATAVNSLQPEVASPLVTPEVFPNKAEAEAQTPAQADTLAGAPEIAEQAKDHQTTIINVTEFPGSVSDSTEFLTVEPGDKVADLDLASDQSFAAERSTTVEGSVPAESFSEADGSSTADGSLPADGSGAVGGSLAAESETNTGAAVQLSGLALLLETSSDLTGRIAAFRQLAGKWNESLPEQFLQPACRLLGQQGLRCLGFGSWQQLQRYNRPAILVLSHNNQLHHVILNSVNGQSAEVQVGGTIMTVPTVELQNRLTGDGLIIWRPGESGNPFFQQGDSSLSIPPLRSRMNQAFAKVRLPLLRSVDDRDFDLDMSQKVFTLQTRYSILADSKVGNETYLLLNELLQTDVTPLLTQRTR